MMAAAFLVREVLLDGGYLRHGITLHPGDLVVDVGAHVGLFGAAVLSSVPDGDVLYVGIEPAPDTFRALQLNMLGTAAPRCEPSDDAHAVDYAAGNDALSDTTSDGVGAGLLSWEPQAPAVHRQSSFFALNSGQYGAPLHGAVAPAAAVRHCPPYPSNVRLLCAAVSHQAGTALLHVPRALPGNATLRPLEKMALQGHVMGAALCDAQRVRVRTVSLEQLLDGALRGGGGDGTAAAGHGCGCWRRSEQVSLIKVDVEGEELAVLQGLPVQRWADVRQAVIEVHDVPAGKHGRTHARTHIQAHAGT